jgi:putative chitobiose transport system permease protein
MSDRRAEATAPALAGEAAERAGAGRRAGALLPYRRWTPYLFILPGFAVLAVFSLAAMAQVIGYSFTDYNAFNDPGWVGLANYRRLAADERFWFCLLNSFAYLLVTPVLMVLSLSAAMLVHTGLRWAWGLRMWLFFPVITPTIVAAIAWRVLLNEDSGLFNAAIEWLGGGGINWLSERPWTLMSAMLVTMWKGFGYFMMVFLAGLVAIPRELHEAATVDGAGRLNRFLHVVLPGLRPVLVLVALISSVSALKVFDELYVTIQGAPISHQTSVPLIFDTAFDRGEFGLACAQGVVLFVVVLAFSLVQLRVGGDR